MEDTLNNDRIPQLGVISRFLLKFFRFNYRLIRVQQDQSANNHFLQSFNRTKLLLTTNSKHPDYRNPIELHTPCFFTFTFDNDLVLEQSETSDS